MSNFPRPRLELIDDHIYQLIHDYSYVWEHDGTLYRITVPVKFITDLGSVPRPLWWLISPQELRSAAIHHDWIYMHQGRLGNSFQVYTEEPYIKRWVTCEGVWSRRDTDRLFGRMLREANVPRWKRRAAFLAVHYFGQQAWDSYTQEG